MSSPTVCECACVCFASLPIGLGSLQSLALDRVVQTVAVAVDERAHFCSIPFAVRLFSALSVIVFSRSQFAVRRVLSVVISRIFIVVCATSSSCRHDPWVVVRSLCVCVHKYINSIHIVCLCVCVSRVNPNIVFGCMRTFDSTSHIVWCDTIHNPVQCFSYVCGIQQQNRNDPKKCKCIHTKTAMRCTNVNRLLLFAGLWSCLAVVGHSELSATAADIVDGDDNAAACSATTTSQRRECIESQAEADNWNWTAVKMRHNASNSKPTSATAANATAQPSSGSIGTHWTLDVGSAAASTSSSSPVRLSAQSQSHNETNEQGKNRTINNNSIWLVRMMIESPPIDINTA